MSASGPIEELHRLISDHCLPAHRARALSILEKVISEVRARNSNRDHWLQANGGHFAGNEALPNGVLGWSSVTGGVGAWGVPSFAGVGVDMGGPMGNAWDSGGGFAGGSWGFGGAGVTTGSIDQDEVAVLNLALDGPGLG